MADNHVKKTITNLPTNTGKVTIVLINAVLENVHTQNGPYLLESNAHHKHIRKLKSDPSLFRPDILHHCLLTLIDSPLNKAGKLSLFISTHKVNSNNHKLIKT